MGLGLEQTRFYLPARRRAVVSVFASAAVIFAVKPTSAQPFVEETDARLPGPTPEEYSEQVDFADVDGDGDLDIAFANGAGFSAPQQQQLTRLYINNGTGVFTDQTATRLPGTLGYTRDVEFGDVDQDGDLDCLVVNTFNTLSRLLINNGLGFFADETATRLPLVAFSGSDADFGDVENDGDLDIIFTNAGTTAFGAGQDKLYLNNGAGVFTDGTAGRLPVQMIAESIDCDFADVDGDLDLDLIMAHRNASSRLWRNDGTGQYTDITDTNLPAAGSGTYSIDVGDIDGDIDLDLLIVRGTTDRVFRNNGAGVFTDVSATALPSNPSQDDNDGDFLDLDNDGDLDMAIAHLGAGGERFYVNNGAGVFSLTPGMITVVNDSSLDIEFGDLTGDGRLDVVTAQGESGNFRNRIYINHAQAADTRAPTFPLMTQLPDTSQTTGPYVVRAVIRDAMTSDNNFFDRGVWLRYRVDDAPVQTVRMRYSGGDLYRGVIPGLGAGSRVTYACRATDWAGNTGESNARSFQVTGGILGDGDGDGDIDGEDMGIFLHCFTGPDHPRVPECAAFDRDGDVDVDFADFSGFQRAFTGD